jgi:hypothetical protein
MKKRHFAVGHYWNDEAHYKKYPTNENSVAFYSYHREIQYGTEKDAENFLDYVKSRSEKGCEYYIFWIDTERNQ